MPKKKITTLILLILSTTIVVGFLVFVGVSYAAYRNSLKAQRAIAPYSTSKYKFSSNYLINEEELLEGEINDITVYTNNISNPPQTFITICNYEQGKQTQYFHEDITYSIVIKAVKSDLTDATASDFSEGETIKFGDFTIDSANLTKTISNKVLSGGETSSDSYRIVFSKYDSSLRLEVTAIPNLSLPTLVGVFNPGVRAEGAINSWTGGFSEDTSKPTSAYNGFNYIVTGFGKGSVTLTWNNSILDISIASLLEFDLGSPVVDGSISTITFNVDSGDIGRYDIQFYIKDITGTSWDSDQMIDNSNNKVVELTFS